MLPRRVPGLQQSIDSIPRRNSIKKASHLRYDRSCVWWWRDWVLGVGRCIIEGSTVVSMVLRCTKVWSMSMMIGRATHGREAAINTQSSTMRGISSEVLAPADERVQR